MRQPMVLISDGSSEYHASARMQFFLKHGRFVTNLELLYIILIILIDRIAGLLNVRPWYFNEPCY